VGQSPLRDPFLEADRERIESQMPPPKPRKQTPRKPKS
jgi:hypothetical protein